MHRRMAMECVFDICMCLCVYFLMHLIFTTCVVVPCGLWLYITLWVEISTHWLGMGSCDFDAPYLHHLRRGAVWIVVIYYALSGNIYSLTWHGIMWSILVMGSCEQIRMRDERNDMMPAMTGGHEEIEEEPNQSFDCNNPGHELYLW